MSRSLSQSLCRLPLRRPPSLTLPPRLLARRAQSNEPAHDADPSLRKLEDAMHCIAVRRSEPDWLPFLPGSSYWVPPPGSSSAGLARLIERMANPLSPEESSSTTATQGWPSSDYFVKG